MEEKEVNGSQKVLLSILGVIVLVVAVVGITYAAASFGGTSSANTISTGTITMSYTEPENGINLVNALPTSDAAGKASTEKFEFTVSTKATGAVTIPYEISVTPKTVTESTTIGALSPKQVKINLTKDGTEVVAPTTLAAGGFKVSTLRSGASVIYSTSETFTQGNTSTKTSTYVLRMWLDSAVSTSDIADKTYEYRLLVNVDSTVSAIK